MRPGDSTNLAASARLAADLFAVVATLGQAARLRQAIHHARHAHTADARSTSMTTVSWVASSTTVRHLMTRPVQIFRNGNS